VVEWQLTIDSNHPSRLVRFWAPVLDYEVQPPPEGFETWRAWYVSVGVPADEFGPDNDGTDPIFDPTGAGPKIWFQIVPEPKSGKNRLHLDIDVGGGRAVPLEGRARRVEARVAELLEAGGSVYRRYPADFEVVEDVDRYAVVMGDPEGNEFCVA